MEAIRRKVQGISKPMDFELRPGAYMNKKLDILDWGAYDPKGEFICAARTKEKLIQKVIWLVKQGPERLEEEKLKWMSGEGNYREGG
jgi:hypothetical protein